MAYVHAGRHTRNDSGISIHSVPTRDESPSPTLTNPDMILPTQPWEHRTPPRGPHSLLVASLSNASSQRNNGNSTSLGVATAVQMPVRGPAPSLTTIPGHEHSLHDEYLGYEHGAPLSDIYEESEAPTPKSKAAHRSRSPSPAPALDEPGAQPKKPNTLRHKKRLSSLSSSSGGSDGADWENFDVSKVLSGRAAADLAQMKREENLEVDVDEETSRRQSREEEELAALNARAEKILENARKRLTHMSDNLKVARTSVLPAPRSSPQMKDHQPAGGLYRSISAAGASKLAKSKPLYPPLKAPSSLQHIRGGSDTGLISSSQLLAHSPNVRSASAMEYGSTSRFNMMSDSAQSPSAKFQPSPASNRSFNSPLVTLEEEDHDSPSTQQTSPESVNHNTTPPATRGLGIHHIATKSVENLADTMERPSSRQTPTPSQLNRSSSAASVRSAKELKEQMTDLRSRIADIKTRAHADTVRRRSYQNLRSPSPSAQPEQYYTSSPAYKADNSSPVNTSAGVGWRVGNIQSSIALARSMLDGPRDDSSEPITPANARFLDVEHLTPGAESRMLSSVRTDRNTPTLARNRPYTSESSGAAGDDSDSGSAVPAAEFEGAPGPQVLTDGDEGAEDEKIAENEEEQIYLNEVLEESLHAAEVEPDVPAIPGSYLETSPGVLAVAGLESERHEDRIDAFDYENMFLHSAMGTYTGKSINGSDSGSDDQESDDDDSVDTKRAGVATPTNDLDGDGSYNESEALSAEVTTDEEMEDVIAVGKSPDFSVKTQSTQAHHKLQPRQLQSPPQMRLPKPQKARMIDHGRKDSLDSISTTATFETASEGDDNDDEMPREIYNFGESGPAHAISTNSPYRTQGTNPVKARFPQQHIVGSPTQRSDGRDTPSSVSTVMQLVRSPISPARQPYRIISSVASPTSVPLPRSPGLGLGVIGAENAQYINNNGVPERFQGQPSPTHSRNGSQQTQATLQYRPSSTATQRHTRQISANGIPLPTTPLADTSEKTSPSTAASSPQRKVVLNRSLRHPPPMQVPPDMPLPPPPPAVQSNGVKSRTLSPQHQLQPAFEANKPVQAVVEQDTAQLPNTEILMESLIKLADPDFSLPHGSRFADIDKDLVLGLLRAVGGVCNGVLRAGKYTTGQVVVDELRSRLDGARQVLDGQKPAFDDRERWQL